MTVIIVSWNTRELLEQCLESLCASASHHRAEGPGAPAIAQDEAHCDVVVVDNASSDGSAQMVRERFPRVRIVENRENVGFARANNQAIRASDARYVLLLNPDTVVRPGAIEALTRFMDSRPDAGAAGARLVNPDGSLQVSCQPAPGLARELWRLFHLDRLRPLARYPMETWSLQAARRVDVVQGAAMMLRRDALDEVGLLDEEYFMYSEETDLCYRLRQRGWQVYWVPEAVVVHYGGQSTRQIAAAMFQCLYQSKVLYFRKHGGPGAARAYKAILVAAALARLLVSPLAWLEPADARSRHLTLARHYRRLPGALLGL